MSNNLSVDSDDELENIRDYIASVYKDALEVDFSHYTGATHHVSADYIMDRLMAWHKQSLQQECLKARIAELDEAFIKNSPAFADEVDLNKYWDEYYQNRFAQLTKDRTRDELS